MSRSQVKVEIVKQVNSSPTPKDDITEIILLDADFTMSELVDELLAEKRIIEVEFVLPYPDTPPFSILVPQQTQVRVK